MNPVDTNRGTYLDRLPIRFPAASRTIPVILERQAQQLGVRRLFVFGEIAWSYAETLEKAKQAGASLATAGIAAGDRVAILCSNRPEFLQMFLGCAWIGAVLVPINVAARGPQLAHVLSNSAAKLLIVEADFLASFAALGSLPGCIRTLWVLGTVPAEPLHGRAPTPIPAVDATVPAAPVLPGDTVAILYTSGTTGPAKGVCCPHAQFFWWGVNTAKGLGLQEGDVLLTTLPLFHTNALNCFCQALLTGATYVLEPRFSASGFWPAVKRHQATVGYLLGAMAAILLAQPAGAADRAHVMRVALGGGVPTRFHAPFRERFGVPLLDAYGSTETNFTFASRIPSDHPGTMGYLCDGFEAAVVDEGDVPVADGQAGELLLRPRAPFAFATGYFGMAEATVEAWRNLWFHTGDRVVREADGNYRFIDRMKDAIRRRGENVSSWEVEQVLQAHAAVASCAVYAVPAEIGEDEIMAAIVLEPGVTVAPAEILDFCLPRLAYFAIPRFIDFVDAFPLTENGKIQKVRLRERGVTSTTWDREKAGYQVKRPGASPAGNSGGGQHDRG
jgi:crotonobetaine/carnitine-CoA ligase